MAGPGFDPRQLFQDLSNGFTPQLLLQLGRQCGSPSSEKKCAAVRSGKWALRSALTQAFQTFAAPSFDDKILEVVAVFGSMQMAVSRVIKLQHHRIAQVSAMVLEAGRAWEAVWLIHMWRGRAQPRTTGSPRLLQWIHPGSEPRRTNGCSTWGQLIPP